MPLQIQEEPRALSPLEIAAVELAFDGAVDPDDLTIEFLIDLN